MAPSSEGEGEGTVVLSEQFMENTGEHPTNTRALIRITLSNLITGSVERMLHGLIHSPFTRMSARGCLGSFRRRNGEDFLMASRWY